MTSRAEYRLLLRQDNADLRLTPIGYEVGLISEERYKAFLDKKENVKKEIERLKNVSVKPTEETNKFLEENGSTPIKHGVKIIELLRRSEISYKALEVLDKDRPALTRQEAE